MPAFRKQKTSVLNPASTSSQEQPVNRKQTTIQAPRSSSHRQQDEPHHHSIYTEIHDDVHPLSLPAFRKQSLSTADPASTSSQERPVNYRRQKHLKQLLILHSANRTAHIGKVIILKFKKVTTSILLASRLSGNRACAMVIPLLHQARNKLQKESTKHHKDLRIKLESPTMLTLQLYPMLPANNQQENSWSLHRL